jgi:hypothetical protein
MSFPLANVGDLSAPSRDDNFSAEVRPGFDEFMVSKKRMHIWLYMYLYMYIHMQKFIFANTHVCKYIYIFYMIIFLRKYGQALMNLW